MLRLERVSNPLHLGARHMHAHNIEAARPGLVLRVAEQIVARGFAQPIAFADVDRLGGCAQARVAARSNFDEHQCGAILHHQVEFAHATPIVAGKWL